MVDLTKTTSVLEITAKTTGVDQAAASLEGVATAQESVSKSTLSAERAWERLQRQNDQNYRALVLFEKQNNDAKRAIDLKLTSDERYNEVLALNKQRLDDATGATARLAAANNAAAKEAAAGAASMQAAYEKTAKAMQDAQAKAAALAQSNAQAQQQAAAGAASMMDEYVKRSKAMQDQQVKAQAEETKAAALVRANFEATKKSLDANFGALKAHEAEQENLTKAHKAGGVQLAEYNQLMALSKQRYEQATVANDNFNKSVNAGTGQQRLARHELINLSRQLQDVGVGLASGQGFFTIMVQQGTQIADVFATSTGTLRGFFSQAAAGFMGFIASAAGVVTAIAAIGIAAATAAFTYASGQRDIERALAATGRASGVTRDQINEIAVASRSGFGISISEAREAATAFAATGKVYADNVGRATHLVDLFARAGVGAEDSTKKLAAALVDPAKGALELEKDYRFLNTTMLDNIRRMQTQGDLQGAQRALIEGLTPKIRELAQHTGIMSQGWTATTAAASNFFKESIGGSLAASAATQKQLEQQQELLKSLEAQRQLPAVVAGPAEDREMLARQIEATTKEIDRLKSSMDSTNKAIEESKLGLLGLEAQALERALLPGIQRIEDMTTALNKLREARLAADAAKVQATATGPDAISGAAPPDAAIKKTAPSGAETVLAVGLQQEKEKLETLIRQAQVTQQIAAMYPGMTQQGALQLYNLQQQTVAAQAVGTAGQLQAQQQASFNMMVAQGVAPLEAIRIAVAQTALAQAQINAQAQVQLVAAQGQLTIAQARGGAEKIVAEEQVRIAQLLAQQVPLGKALEIAATERAAKEENVRAAIENQIKSLKDQERLINARKNGNEASVKAEIAYEKAIKDGSGQALAEQLRDQTYRVEKIKEAEEAERELEQAAEAVRQQVEQTRQAQIAAHNQQMNQIAETRAANNAAYADMEEKIGFSVTYWLGLQDAVTGAFEAMSSFGLDTEIFTKPGGGYSQFDPEGYVSEVPPPWIGPTEKEIVAAAEATWGPGGYTLENAGKTSGGFRNLFTASLAKAVPTEQGKQFVQQQLIEAGLQQGDTLQDAFQKTMQGPFEDSKQLMQQIIGLASPTEQAGMLQQAIERAREQPATLANEQLIKQLTDQLKGLTTSTDSLNATLQSALSPYYSQDPRTTKLGFRAGVTGNPAWMTGATNESALDAILGPGATAPTVTTTTVTSTSSSGSSGSTLTSGAIQLPDEIRYPSGSTGFASGGSFIVPGGYSSNDNKMVQFPAASGEQVVVNRTPQDGGGDKPSVVNIDNRIVIVGGVDNNTLGKFKVSRYQQGQKIRASMAG